jgi:dihydroorotase
VLEFEYAKYGMIGLQTAFAVVKTAMPAISNERLVELFSTAPRKIFGLGEAGIKENAKSSLTLFAPESKWTVDEKDNQSLSSNSPFFGKELTGRPIGIINKEQVFLNE